MGEGREKGLHWGERGLTLLQVARSCWGQAGMCVCMCV